MKKFLSALLSMAFLAAALGGIVNPVKAMQIVPATGLAGTIPIGSVNFSSILPSPAVVGQPISVRLWIIGPTTDAIPTGTILISDNLSTKTCTANLAPNGTYWEANGSCILRLDTVGVHTLTAVYSGDDIYAAGASAQTQVIVNKAQTTIFSFYIDGTSRFGQSQTAHVILMTNPLDSGNPTGWMEIKDSNGHVYCATTTTSSGTGECSFNADYIGSKDIIAVYAGDANFEGSTSQPYTLNINKAIPTVQWSAIPATSEVGQAVQFTVTVTGVPGYTPVGRGLIRYDNGLTCPGFDLVNGSGSCTITFTYPANHSITVRYVGEDSGYYQSVDQPDYYLVDLANAVPVITSTGPSPSLPGGPFTTNFQLSPQFPDSGAPTGSVTIKAGDQALCTATLPVTSCDGTIAAAGSYALTAEYSGDTTFNPGTSAAFTHLVSYGDTFADPAGLCGGSDPCFTSLQSAILAAAPGRTVTVYPGLYGENINLNKAVTVNLNGAVLLEGSLTIAAGTFNSTTGTLSVTGDVFETGGVFNPNGGTLRLYGPAGQKLQVSSAINNLTIDKAGPSGFWRFDEGQGVVISDSSPNHLDGNLINGLPLNGSFTGQPPTLNYGNNYALLTGPAYVSIPNSDGLGLSEQFTLAAWAYWNGDASVPQVLLSRPYRDDVSQQAAGLSLSVSNGRPVLLVFDGTVMHQLSASQPAPMNQWFHIAATFDGQIARIYLNGEKLGEQDYGSVQSVAAANTSFLIGREFQTGAAVQAWNGKVDEVQVYPQALTAAEIAILSHGDEARNTVTLSSGLALTGSLTLSNGTLDVSTNNYPIHLQGNWVRQNGVLNPHQATVTLTGTEQAISGANTFYHLTRTNPGHLTFPSGLTQTVAGGLTLQGAAGSPLVLAGDTANVQWKLDPQGSRSLSDLTVSDSANINSQRIDATQNGILSQGNNTGWDFSIPTVSPLSTTATEDQETLLTLTSTDGDGDPLTLKVTSLPTFGKLYQVTGGVKGAEITSTSLPATITDTQHRLVYLFTVDGPDQVTFNLQVSDGLVTGSGTVSLNLINVNDLPVISAIADQSMDENTSLGPLAFTVSDEETAGDQLVVTVTSSNPSLIPSTGLILGGVGANRTLRITPAVGMTGSADITLSVQDGGMAIASHSFKVTVNAVNEPPVSADKTVTMAEDASYAFKLEDFAFSDTHQDLFSGLEVVKTVSAGSLSGPSGTIGDGTPVLDPTKLSFIPAADAYGSPYTSFTFRVRDRIGAYSDIYTFTINVTAAPDAPVAQDDDYTTDEDTPLVVGAIQGVLLNDLDVDNDTLTAVLVTLPSLGDVTLASDGSFSYQPNPNANGVDSFTYRASDGSLTSQIATVTIHITPVDDPPVIQIAVTPSGLEGTPVSLKATYIDPDTGQDVQPGDVVVWDFGDNLSEETSVLSVAHTFMDNGNYTVQAWVKGQLQSAGSISVIIENVAPQITAGGDVKMKVGESLHRAIFFTDPGAENWSATVDYGDGSSAEYLSLSSRSFVLEHTYNQKGNWRVVVTVKDDDGGQGSTTFQATVGEDSHLFLPLVVH